MKTMELSKEEQDLAREARNAYQRKYAKENRKRINQHQRNWHKANPGKAKEYNQRYWLKKAEERKA